MIIGQLGTDTNCTMKALMGNGHKPPRILGLGIRQRCKLQSPATSPLSKEHPFVAHFPKLYCNATLDSIEVLGSTQYNHFHPTTKQAC